TAWAWRTTAAAPAVCDSWYSHMPLPSGTRWAEGTAAAQRAGAGSGACTAASAALGALGAGGTGRSAPGAAAPAPVWAISGVGAGPGPESVVADGGAATARSGPIRPVPTSEGGGGPLASPAARAEPATGGTTAQARAATTRAVVGPTGEAARRRTATSASHPRRQSRDRSTAARTPVPKPIVDPNDRLPARRHQLRIRWQRTVCGVWASRRVSVRLRTAPVNPYVRAPRSGSWHRHAPQHAGRGRRRRCTAAGLGRPAVRARSRRRRRGRLRGPRHGGRRGRRRGGRGRRRG